MRKPANCQETEVQTLGIRFREGQHPNVNASIFNALIEVMKSIEQAC